jgi:hypothetical protein
MNNTANLEHMHPILTANNFRTGLSRIVTDNSALAQPHRCMVIDKVAVKYAIRTTGGGLRSIRH